MPHGADLLEAVGARLSGAAADSLVGSKIDKFECTLANINLRKTLPDSGQILAELLRSIDVTSSYLSGCLTICIFSYFLKVMHCLLMLIF